MKRFLTLSISVLSLLTVNAQTTDRPPKKFGIRIGGSYSLMNFNKGVPQPVPAVPNTWKAGADFRVVMNVALSQSITLQPEYALSVINSEDKRIAATYQLSYLSLPVLFRIAVTKQFALLAGPQFDLLIRAEEKKNGSKTNITHDTEERNISGVAGLEFMLPANLYLDARYVHGFNHVGLGQRTSTREFKWQGISVGIGLRF